jgi:hypothetical protein
MNLSKLVKAGATISLSSGITEILAHAEVLDGQLFWVRVFPESQQHSHVLAFNEEKEIDAGALAYYRKKKMVAYITPIPESDLSSAIAEADWSLWQNHLEENRPMFEQFVRDQREYLLGS